MLRSLRRVCAGDLVVFVVCMDELTRILLEKLDLPWVCLIPIHELENNDTELLNARGNRSHVEYLWTCTSTIILRILQRNPHIDIISYLDADLYFFSDVEPVFSELGDASVAIHEHRFPPNLTFLQENGVFNVGWLTFRNDEKGLAVLRWWRDRCLEWCYARQEDGKMGDQGYLNDWPQRFDGVHVIRHLGVGVAPWNQEQYKFSANDACPYVDGAPVVFYHFHSFGVLQDGLVVPCFQPLYKYSSDIINMFVVPYLEQLEGQLAQVRSLVREFSFGFSKEPLPGNINFLLAKSLAEQVNLSEVPQRMIALNSDWVLFASEQFLY